MIFRGFPRCAAIVLASAAVWAAGQASGAPLTATLREVPRPETGYFAQGTTRDPAGHILSLDNYSLLLDGQRWMPAMGEFHYARYPAEEWREELLKMKAGGIDIVSTYVFWIHHEETEGAWNWNGQRDLRRFVETARDAGLNVVVRCGPWCHGEVRNGGLPEWVVQRKDWKLRSTDPKFLAAVRELYGQIAQQVHGLLWKDGGPVIGIQLDNEYYGPAEYLRALKSIAREAGLDVPLYTRTGWPELTTPMPVGDIVPLYGVYAEGFWDRDLTSMPARYWAGFQFSTLRTDAAIATELLGQRAARDAPDVAKYPYLTCEIGGGMMNSYHRRILIDPRDVEATTLVKIGGGSTLPGYYMYHGGTNPEGEHTTLMEAQDTLTTNYNDLPVKTYDFQAPIGEFGEIRPQYHRLRRLHLFLRDHGSDLAAMLPVLPDQRPSGPHDDTTLRWAARSDGRSGFVFVSNYERSKALGPKAGVQFSLRLSTGEALVFPTQPVTVPSDAMFIWPFNLDCRGADLVWATATPLTHCVAPNGVRTLFFAATNGIPAEFAFSADRIIRIESSGRVARADGKYVITGLSPGHTTAWRFLTRDGDVVQGVVLDEADSLACWKGSLGGRQRVFLTTTNLVFDHGSVRATATEAGPQSVSIFPAPADVTIGEAHVFGTTDGIFRRYALPAGWKKTAVSFEAVRPAGPLRTIPRAPRKDGVAMEPSDADFAAAAAWRVQIPAGDSVAGHALLRFHYVGDVARVLCDGKLMTDDFYNGRPRDIGLWRYPVTSGARTLEFLVLPLQKDAPVFLAPIARPAFGDRAAVADLQAVEMIEAKTFTLNARPGLEPILPDNFKTDFIPARPVRRGLDGGGRP